MTKKILENKHCPLCKKNNNCCNGLEKSLGVCWCTLEQFPQAIFDLVPEEQIRKACICKSCLDSFKKSLTNNEK